MYNREELLESGYFIDNEYFSQYYDLISRNEQTEKIQYKTNSHHIIPAHYYKNKNINVDNSSSNRVNLLYKDHLLAHILMSACTQGQDRWRNIYSAEYLSGRKYVTEEDITYMKQNLDNYQKLYEEAIKAAPNHWKGKKRGIETREKMSRAQKGKPSAVHGKIWVNKDNTNKAILPSEKEQFIKDGWKLGRKVTYSDEALAKMDAARRKPRSKEFCEKMREQGLRQPPKSEESIEKQRQSIKNFYKTHENPFKGRKHTEESKQKMRESLSNKICVNNGERTICIVPKNLEKYLAEGWKVGTIVREAKHDHFYWMNNGEKNKRVKPEDVEKYETLGYTYGMIQ